MSKGKLYEGIEKEFKTGYDCCYSSLAPSNISEVAGLINLGIKPNVLTLIDKMKRDFPTPCHDPQVDDWFTRWLGEEE